MGSRFNNTKEYWQSYSLKIDIYTSEINLYFRFDVWRMCLLPFFQQ